MTSRIGCLLALLLTSFSQAQESDPWAGDSPRMVLIIDDVGTSLARGQAILALPGPITYAVLPFTPYSGRLSREALQRGKEVILHAPMANLRNLKPGPGALTPAQNREQMQKTLNDALDAVPEAIGVNNHMGSLLTQLDDPMRWVMEVVKQRRLFFIDSRTTARTLALKSAQQAGIPALERDVFLDNERTPEAIAAQFRRAIALAHRDGSVVVIGHPYPETAAFLQHALPALGEEGVTMMSASAFLAERDDARRRYLARRADPD